MKLIKRFFIIVLIVALVMSTLCGCEFLESYFGGVKENLVGRDFTNLMGAKAAKS